MKTGSRFFRFYRKKRNSPPSAGLRTLSRGERGREGGERKKKNVIIIKKRRNKERGRGEERENGAYARFLEHGRKGWPLLRISQGRNR